MNDQFHEVVIVDDSVIRRARILDPPGAAAVMVFVHGGGVGGRSSIRDGYVARRMHDVGVATVHVDLLAPPEASGLGDANLVMLLAERLERVAPLVASDPAIGGRPLAYFGSGTGSAAALLAAASHGPELVSVVCCGGPVELALGRATQVDAPTLVLVCEAEPDAVRRAEALVAAMRCENGVEIVPGASRLFDDRAVLDHVAARASTWVFTNLGAR